MPQFVGPRLKVDWARRHIRAIDDVLRTFLETQPFKLFVIPDGIAMEVTQELPAEVALLIGDAVHNMRSALDLLACDLVRLNNKSANKVHFPFSHNALELDEQIKKKNFHRAGKDAVDLLKTMKPYTGGNALLRGIHDLDILDKHQLIVPIFNTAMVRSMTITANGSRMVIEDSHFIGERFSFGLPPNARVEPGWVIEALPAFSSGVPKPFANSKVIGSLEGGAKLVLEIIEAFEACPIGKAANSSAVGGAVGKGQAA